MPFSPSKAPFASLPFLPELFRKYAQNAPQLESFYAFKPTPDGIKKAGASVSMDQHSRKVLVNALLRQNGTINLHPSTLQNIHALLDSRASTICTGHQLNLLGGPLYFVSKILSVIRLCEELNRESSASKFIPVYWMHAEDHDFDEISSVTLFGKKHFWNAKQEGPSGSWKLDGIEQFLDEVFSSFRDEPYAKQLRHLTERAYSSEITLAEATRGFVNELFGKYGLVILDASDKQLKELFRPVLVKEILEKKSFTLVDETNKALEKLGFAPQVNPREINLFYLEEGMRERIVEEKGVFRAGNRVFSKDQLVELCESRPECFSPNVVLRSVYQQSILPNAAYVGGPAEVSYWLQYKSLIQHYSLTFPALVARNSVLIADEKHMSRFTGMGFKPEDIFRNEDELIREMLSRSGKENETGFDGKTELESLERLGNSIIERMASIDPTLREFAGSELQKMKKILEGIETKALRAMKKKEEESVNRIRSLKARLFPGGRLLEREEGFLTYFARRGNEFFDNLKDQMEPVPANVLLLTEKTEL